MYRCTRRGCSIRHLLGLKGVWRAWRGWGRVLRVARARRARDRRRWRRGEGRKGLGIGDGFLDGVFGPYDICGYGSGILPAFFAFLYLDCPKPKSAAAVLLYTHVYCWCFHFQEELYGAILQVDIAQHWLTKKMKKSSLMKRYPNQKEKKRVMSCRWKHRLVTNI